MDVDNNGDEGEAEEKWIHTQSGVGVDHGGQASDVGCRRRDDGDADRSGRIGRRMAKCALHTEEARRQNAEDDTGGII